MHNEIDSIVSKLRYSQPVMNLDDILQIEIENNAVYGVYGEVYNRIARNVILKTVRPVVYAVLTKINNINT